MGGSCSAANDTGNNYDPDPTSTKYADLKIGETFEHGGYCEWCTESSVNCGSDEFTRAGNGQGKCKCRALCNDGCCRKLCKRTSYNGDPYTCCTTGTKVLGKGKTCDPKYRSYGTSDRPISDCNEHMIKFCSINDNLLKNGKCREWYNANKDAADGLVISVCNKYINDPACICIKAANEINAKFPTGNKLAVECIDNRCVNSVSALRTKKMRENNCEIVNCDMDIESIKLVLNAPNSTFRADFVQNCQGKNIIVQPNDPSKQVIIPTTADPNASDEAVSEAVKRADWANITTYILQPTGNDFKNMTPVGILYTIFIVFIAILILGGGVLLFGKTRNKRRNMNSKFKGSSRQPQ